METIKVGIREFWADLAVYIASSTPMAVARHGQAIDYFIPTQGQVDANIGDLNKASKPQIKYLPRTMLTLLQLCLTSKLLAIHQAPSKSIRPRLYE